ncbi:MAG: hypothetical protein ABIP41_00230 [Croceibacterium sp.]
MKNLAALTALVLLAACGNEQPAPQPTVAAVATPTTPVLPAPDDKVFAAAFAKACPKADKVNTSLCKSGGMGSPDFICQYGLGKDTYLRNTVTLTQADQAWVVKDADKACAQGAK